MPAALWGHQACGVAPTVLIDIERKALACAAFTYSGRCRYVGLMLSYGPHLMPSAVIIRETIREWMAIVHKHILEEGTANTIAAAWNRTAKKLIGLSSPKLTSHIQGVMSNVIVILI